MTGTESGFLRRLLRALPFSREGRFSLSRLFFNFYLVAMGSFVVIAFIADLIISAAQRGISDDYSRRFMRGTITLIEEDLARYPRSAWPKRIKVLDEKFAYRLEIGDRYRLPIPPSQAPRLDKGEIAIAYNGEIMYHLIRGTDQVLVLGPLAPGANPELAQRGMPLELRLRLLTWSLIGIIFAIALWFWVRPIWRDFESLRNTTQALGEGHFDARAPAARSHIFQPMAEILNGMAERIQQLIATQRDISSAISHELRTPIARLRFALEMQGETDDVAERQRLMRMMDQDIDELDALIDASLTYARLEREHPQLHFVRTDLAIWLTAQVEAMRLLARNLTLDTDFGRLNDADEVDIDQKAMAYAVKNLLRNAFKYARTRVDVRAEIRNGRATIIVDDDGIGVPVDDRERIFSAFIRLDRSRDRATGGYGLGLAIVRSVVELHGGQSSAADSPTGGARFILNWPALRP